MIVEISRFIFLIILLFGVRCDVGPNRSINSDNGYEFLQVPSPEWADQILYFIVTDRFMDGDSTNNDQGTGEYKKEMEVFGMEVILKELLKRLIIYKSAV